MNCCPSDLNLKQLEAGYAVGIWTMMMMILMKQELEKKEEIWC
jgi:hypothetical protein